MKSGGKGAALRQNTQGNEQVPYGMQPSPHLLLQIIVIIKEYTHIMHYQRNRHERTRDYEWCLC